MLRRTRFLVFCIFFCVPACTGGLAGSKTRGNDAAHDGASMSTRDGAVINSDGGTDEADARITDSDVADAQEVPPCTLSKDVTDRITTLGIPLQARYPSGAIIYGRNVWDMQAFEGRIYFGGGDSDENYGPVPIVSYRPASNEFVQEGMVNDEQIDVYRIVNGVLMIPGHDAREGWELGNYYRLVDGTWEKVRTIPDAAHVFDLKSFGGVLFAAGSSTAGGNAFRSRDNGATWDSYVVNFYRAHVLFELGGTLFVSGFNSQTSTWNGTTFVPLESHQFFKNYTPPKGTYPGFIPARITRNVNFGAELVYVLGEGDSDHQWSPVGLWAARSATDVRRLTLPGNVLPHDILARENALYVVSHPPNDETTNIVYGTRDLDTWTEVLRFTTDTFAHSFELLDGSFYFGLNTDLSPLRQSVGTILRVEPEDYCPLP